MNSPKKRARTLRDKPWYIIFAVRINDPPGPGRIGGHYFHTLCSCVHLSKKQKLLSALKTKHPTGGSLNLQNRLIICVHFILLSLSGAFNPGIYMVQNPVADSSSTSFASSSPHVMARAGTNITLACPGITPTSYIYLVEWKCMGCECKSCPNPNGEGARLLRYVQDSTIVIKYYSSWFKLPYIICKWHLTIDILWTFAFYLLLFGQTLTTNG